MLDAVEGLVQELRAVGIPVSTTEHLDAVRALEHVALGDRAEVKAALRTSLVKTVEHQAAYDVVFDLFFALDAATGADGSDDRAAPGDDADAAGAGGAGEGAAGDGGAPSGPGGGGGGGLAELDDGRIRELLLDALQQQDSLTMRRIAGLLVDRHSRIEPGRPVAGTFYLLRAMRAVDADAVPGDLLARDREAGDAAGIAGRAADLRQRLAIEEYRARLEGFRREVESQIRRRLVADRGAAAVARTVRRPLPEDIEFLQASQRQVDELRSVMQPLARKLAARLAEKRRHHRRGSLDFRRTVRRSMSTGGVPAEPVFRRARPAKPHLMVIADISGSVSAFAGFTLQLTYALRTEFAAVRCFVFVDGVDEVTHVLEEADDIAAATRRINSEGGGVWLDGRSDYGHALEAFHERYAGEIRSRSTVIVLGDARNNYHAARADVLAAVRRRAGHLYWLNPEPAIAWDTGDSVISEYARHCDAVVECRNLRQLRAFVESLD
jgi:uncharacterized protein with von Willebrand factor type A (vWA) domain